MSEELQKALKEMEDRIVAVVKQELTPEAREEKRYTKKLHNTKLLLKNYRKFKKHTDQAEFTAKSLIDDDLIEMLGEDYEKDHDELYIKSILRTKERTAMMLNYISRVIEFYAYSTKGIKVDNNRAMTLKMAYIEGRSQSQIAEILEVDERTVRRYIEEGITDVAPLMFGIDGVKLS